MSPKTWLEINKDSLLHNVKVFKDLIGPQKKLIAVVKANAYGHGLKEVTKIITNKVNWFAVDSIEEALFIRKQRIKNPILVLDYLPLNSLKYILNNNIRITVYNQETIKKLQQLRPKKKINLHFKIETGTWRQGVLEENVWSIVKLIKKSPYLNLEGLCSHFANIEDTTDHHYAQSQLDQFKKIVQMLKERGVNIPLKHIACTAATILFPETYFDMVRVGIGLYGLWPSQETCIASRRGKDGGAGALFPAQVRVSHRVPSSVILKPVLTWKTIVAQIKKIKKGIRVGYGLTERVKRDTRLAILPVGYSDGYDRKLSSIGNVLIKGHRCKIIGRICMNIMMVDVTDVKNIKLEEEVVLLGKQGREVVSAEEIARKIGTINYEVVARINSNLPRIII